MSAITSVTSNGQSQPATTAGPVGLPVSNAASVGQTSVSGEPLLLSTVLKNKGNTKKASSSPPFRLTSLHEKQADFRVTELSLIVFFKHAQPHISKTEYPILAAKVPQSIKKREQLLVTCNETVALARDYFVIGPISKEASEIEKFNKLIAQRKERLAKYFEILTFYKESPDGKKLVLKKTGETFAISSMDLLKAMLIGFEQEGDKKNHTYCLGMNVCKTGLSIGFPPVNLFYKFEQHQMHCVVIKPSTELGTGGEGSVYRTLHLFHGDVIAFKHCEIPFEDHKNRTIRIAAMIYREIQFQTEVLQGNFSWAQPMPLFTIDRSDNTKVKIGFGTKLFTGNLASWLKKTTLTNNQRLKCITKLIEIFEKAHAANIMHRDFKPHNACYDGDDDNLDLHLIDWSRGEAEKMTGEHYQFTPGFGSLEDEVNREKMEAGKIEKSKHKELYQRIDIYSLGVTIYQIMAGNLIFPYASYDKPEDVKGYPVQNAIFDDFRLLAKQFHVKHIDIIKTMVYKTPSKRPLMPAVKASWHAANASIQASAKK